MDPWNVCKCGAVRCHHYSLIAHVFVLIHGVIASVFGHSGGYKEEKGIERETEEGINWPSA